MVNKSKAKGTAAESAVVKAARTRGFPHSERVVLHGSTDQGDIRLTPALTAGVVVEVKGGKAAERASDQQITAWLAETEKERVNAGAALGVLVTRRPGIGLPNAHRWWAHWTVADFLDLVGATGLDHRPTGHVRMTLDSALALLRAAGYGTQLEERAS